MRNHEVPDHCLKRFGMRREVGRVDRRHHHTGVGHPRRVTLGAPHHAGNRRPRRFGVGKRPDQVRTHLPLLVAAPHGKHQHGVAGAWKRRLFYSIGTQWSWCSNGTHTKTKRISKSTESPSPRQPRSSAIAWRGSLRTRITLPSSSARSSSAIRGRNGSCWSVSPNRRMGGFGSSAPGAQPGRNGTIMRTTSRPKAKSSRSNGLQAEYRFDYSKSKPNRFAGRVRAGSVAVLLDPDVAQVFQNAETVNTVLRALLTTMPARRVPGTR